MKFSTYCVVLSTHAQIWTSDVLLWLFFATCSPLSVSLIHRVPFLKLSHVYWLIKQWTEKCRSRTTIKKKKTGPQVPQVTFCSHFISNIFFLSLSGFYYFFDQKKIYFVWPYFSLSRVNYSQSSAYNAILLFLINISPIIILNYLDFRACSCIYDWLGNLIAEHLSVRLLVLLCLFSVSRVWLTWLCTYIHHT